MRFTHIFLPALILLCLGGCTNIQQVKEVDSVTEMSDWDWFSVKAQTTFTEHIMRDDGSVAFTTYNTATTKREDADFSAHIYPSLSSQCSPSLTGTSQIESLASANAKATWGRVNYEDGYGGEGWQYPYDIKEVVCKIEGTPPPTSAYALCSEKDGKTVVICISQMTDNPEQAKQIFETFRWTK